jgi:uncharacterized protein with ParB-like and HNH nuclease domain
MALSLTAEQKEILKIFKIEEQYVIPAYQRPYSWEYDQCIQLYSDLMEAYEAKEEYFIGNIIIAKSESNKGILEVIDGQQRLTTLLLLIKVLYIFQPELTILDKILEQEDWKGNQKKPRIKSDIFEAKDGHDLNSVLMYDKSIFEKRLEECKDRSGNIDEKKCNHRFEINILYFYNWLLFYTGKSNEIEKFTEFFLEKVYLLPIELTGKTQDEANEKALIIFETINNRGMSLEDADIFKAKLYKKAKNVQEADEFIGSWVDFKNSCEYLNLKIDDVFRYYSHIVRGLQGITTSEKSLREFFGRESFSPFETKKYKEILSDLFKIIEALEFINKQKEKENELAKWLQLIESYTNQYPKFAVVTYLFVNDFSSDNYFVDFLKSLVRYVYYQGSTTRVKFEIYNIIKQVCSKQKIAGYYQDLNLQDFNQLGRLKYGFALLAFYVNRENSLSYYSIDKLISLSDKNQLSGDWINAEIEELIDSIGNFVVLDIPKRNTLFNKKIEYYKSSNIYENEPFFLPSFTYENFKNRDSYLKKQLVDFFKDTR